MYFSLYPCDLPGKVLRRSSHSYKLFTGNCAQIHKLNLVHRLKIPFRFVKE